MYQKISKLVAHGKLKAALQMMIDHKIGGIDSINLLSRYHLNKKNYISGILAHEDYKVERTRILQAVIQKLEEIRSN